MSDRRIAATAARVGNAYAQYERVRLTRIDANNQRNGGFDPPTPVLGERKILDTPSLAQAICEAEAWVTYLEWVAECLGENPPIPDPQTCFDVGYATYCDEVDACINAT